MTIEFRDLKWALVASQHKSLRRAAERLNIRQSTLTRRLRDLEYRLGAVLFERTNSGTRPTIVGREFFLVTQRIVDEIDLAFSKLRSYGRGESGLLSIGVHASLSAGNLRATIIEYQRRFPDVGLRAIDGSSQQLIADLAAQTIDIAVVLEDGARWDDRSQPLWSERVVVAVPINHPLSEREVIYWPELQDVQFLWPEHGPGPELHRLLIAKLGRSEVSHILYQNAGLDRLLTLVGVGMGLLLGLEGATGASYPNVSWREVHGTDGPTRLHFRAYWQADNTNPALATFLAILRERHPDISYRPSS